MFTALATHTLAVTPPLTLLTFLNLQTLLLQLSKNALEHNEMLRYIYCHTFRMNYTAEQAVFVNESVFYHHTDIQGQAWALIGKPAMRKGFFIWKKRYLSHHILSEMK